MRTWLVILTSQHNGKLTWIKHVCGGASHGTRTWFWRCYYIVAFTLYAKKRFRSDNADVSLEAPTHNQTSSKFINPFEEGHTNQVKNYLWRGFIFSGHYVNQGVSFFPIQSINSLLTRNRDLQNRRKKGQKDYWFIIKCE